MIDADGQPAALCCQRLYPLAGQRDCRNGCTALSKGCFTIIDEYQPQQVAIEQVFVNVNPQSTLLLDPGAVQRLPQRC